MKRPFAEIDGARLNCRPVPAPRTLSTCRHSPPRSLRHGLLNLSLGARRGSSLGRLQVDRLDSFGIYSAPDDVRTRCDDAGAPFSLANANSCSLTAVGHESGLVRIFDHSSTSLFGQTDILGLHPHRNAIYDVQWSVDDKHILTAGGDHAACLIDVQAQKGLTLLKDVHQSSVKDVKFDPTNPNICISGGRDGTIAIWDMRYRGDSQATTWYALDGSADRVDSFRNAPDPLGMISRSHDSIRSFQKRNDKGSATPSSITAMLFKRNGQLVTACSSNSFLKTWDLRYIRSNTDSYPLLSNHFPRPSRQTAEIKSQVGTTMMPELQVRRQRDFGVASLALSHDDQRIFSTNKDNKVYEYPSSHPDAGPTNIYEVPELRVASFFCKSSISNDNFLVCGNRSGSPIIIDTLRQSPPAQQIQTDVRATLREDKENHERPLSAARKRTAMDSKFLKISRVDRNTARSFTGGHALEVTGVSWSFDSSCLVTAGDDRCVRTWRRDERRTGSEIMAQSQNAGEEWGYL